MKKFTYLLAVAAVFTACNSGNNGYTVTGTVEGAADGDTVYLETVEGRQFVKLDSAVIKGGTFTFKGTQDTAVNRYISYKAEGKDGAAIDFFLENGKIIINLSQENNSATGTANNDAYQEIRAQINGLNKQMMSIYESMSDTTLTDEQRETKGKEMEIWKQHDICHQSRHQKEHHQPGGCTPAEAELLLHGCGRPQPADAPNPRSLRQRRSHRQDKEQR